MELERGIHEDCSNYLSKSSHMGRPGIGASRGTRVCIDGAQRARRRRPANERKTGVHHLCRGWMLLLGGLLILRRNRALLLLGAFINAMVVLFFFNLYKDRPPVMLSPGGLVSKIAQILLELILLYLLAVSWRKPSH